MHICIREHREVLLGAEAACVRRSLGDLGVMGAGRAVGCRLSVGSGVGRLWRRAREGGQHGKLDPSVPRGRSLGIFFILLVDAGPQCARRPSLAPLPWLPLSSSTRALDPFCLNKPTFILLGTCLSS